MSNNINLETVMNTGPGRKIDLGIEADIDDDGSTYLLVTVKDWDTGEILLIGSAETGSLGEAEFLVEDVAAVKQFISDVAGITVKEA